MRLLAIALLLVLASSCMANHKRNLVSQIMSENQKKEQDTKGDHGLIDPNNHVTDDNDHHYIPRKDYGTHPNGNE